VWQEPESQNLYFSKFTDTLEVLIISTHSLLASVPSGSNIISEKFIFAKEKAGKITSKKIEFLICSFLKRKFINLL